MTEYETCFLGGSAAPFGRVRQRSLQVITKHIILLQRITKHAHTHTQTAFQGTVVKEVWPETILYSNLEAVNPVCCSAATALSLIPSLQN